MNNITPIGRPDGDDLEQQLTATFAHRSADVDFQPHLDLHRAGPARPARPRWQLLSVAAAAVVLLVTGGLLVGNHLTRKHSPPAASQSTSPRPSGESTQPPRACRKNAPATWTSAIASHRLVVDHNVNSLVGVGPDGSLLVSQSQVQGSDSELALFNRDGHRTSITTGRGQFAGSGNTAGIGMVSEHYVVVSLTDTEGSELQQFAVWDRRTNSAPTTVSSVSRAEFKAGHGIWSPTLVGDTVYWITDGTTAQAQLWSQQLPSGTRSHRSIAAGTTLLPARGGVILVDESGQLRSGSVSVPSSVGQTVGMYANPVSDGSAVRWVNTAGFLVSWTPGADTVTVLAHVPDATTVLTTGPLVYVSGTDSEAYDTRTGASVILSGDVSLQAVAGSDLIFSVGGTSAPYTSNLSRVPATELPKVTC